MSEIGNTTSVETGGQEVVNPVDEINETGSTEQEVADPVSEEVEEPSVQDHETNAAFARMRREAEQARADMQAAQKELAELKASNEARNATFSRLTGNDNGEIAAIAEATGMSEDEVIAEMEAAEESAQKDLRIEQLERKLSNLEVDSLMQKDLATIQKIDPTIMSLNDLGEGYADYVVAGLPPEKAYWAIKAEEAAKKSTPPKAVGKVATGTAEKDYYTDAEIDAMSPEQQKANWKKIMASWERGNR